MPKKSAPNQGGVQEYTFHVARCFGLVKLSNPFSVRASLFLELKTSSKCGGDVVDSDSYN
eukprot:3730790-Amphidinium_carterae.1